MMGLRFLDVKGQIHGPRQAKRASNVRKMCGFTSSCTCAKSHPGICSPLKHSLVYTMILFADSKGPDQTAHSRSLIWAFAVRTCTKDTILHVGFDV